MPIYNYLMKKDRLINEFIRLTTFDSESFHEEDIASYLAEKLKNLGLKVEVEQCGNIYGHLKADATADYILFSAHMDTVSPGVGKKAIVKSIDGKEIITSDGTTVLGADDVSGIVSILEALTTIREEKLAHKNIEVVFSVAEEPYCKGMSSFDFSKINAKNGYVLDLTGSIGTIALEAPTIVEIGIDITGKSAHAGFEPENGINGLSVAARALANISTGHLHEDTTLNFGVIKGGSGINVVPEHISIKGEIRSLTYSRIEEVKKLVEEVFTREAHAVGATVEINFAEKIRGYKIDSDSRLVDDYRSALINVGIEQPKIISTFGGSDANPLNQAGIQTAVLSCAMEKVHTTEEFAIVDELVNSAGVTLELMKL